MLRVSRGRTPSKHHKSGRRTAPARSCPQWLATTPAASSSAGDQIHLLGALLQVHLQYDEQAAEEDEGDEEANEHPEEGIHLVELEPREGRWISVHTQARAERSRT